MSGAASVPASAISVPRLRVATFDDYDGVVAVHAAVGMPSMGRDDWRHLWVDNPVWPRVGRDWPIGWVLDSGDRIVGSVFNIPSLYLFQGRELISANGRSWVVDPAYRAFALSLMAEYFSRTDVDLFINTTVGPYALSTNEMFSRRIPAGDFTQTASVEILRDGGSGTALRRKGVPMANSRLSPAAAVHRFWDLRRLRRLLLSADDLKIERVEQFDERFDVFWSDLVRLRPDVLLAVRDRATLAWHFAVTQRRGDLRIFTASSHGRLRGYCILRRERMSADWTWRRPEDGMRLIDFQTLDAPAAVLPWFLRAILEECRREGIDWLEHLGCGLPRLAAFDALAPNRGTWACWPFFFRVVDKALGAQLADPRHWDPSVYDGDFTYS